jgi:predicted dehydrogenase
MPANANRRDVLRGAAAAAAAAGISGSGLAASPARPYRVGVVGSGWFGKLNLHTLMQVAPVEPVALCDVDRHMREEAATLTLALSDSVVPPTRKPALYADYRTMLGAHEFDIVIVATPDHWHALPAIAAMKAGAHVYLEKPISVDIAEGQALVAAARAHDRIVQVGTQRRTSAFLIEARDRVVREGRLGNVGHVEIFGYFHQRPKTFPAPMPAPADLDWDAYCGPAPLVPFNAGIHPRMWRAFMEFCNGYMGDIGVHFIDACRWLLDLGWPEKISSSAGVFVDKASASTVPDTQTATFEFDNLLMTWTNRQWGSPAEPGRAWGATIYGDQGTLKLSPVGYEFIALTGGEHLARQLGTELEEFASDRQLSGADRPLFAITRSHMRDFVRALAAGTRPAADIEEGHISTACCILANLAMKLGRPLRWDGVRQNVVGDDEANRMLARAYRAPWVHPTGAS